MAKQMKPSEVLRKAATLMKRKGVARGALIAREGRLKKDGTLNAKTTGFCALGGIAAAVTFEPWLVAKVDEQLLQNVECDPYYNDDHYADWGGDLGNLPSGPGFKQKFRLANKAANLLIAGINAELEAAYDPTNDEWDEGPNLWSSVDEWNDDIYDDDLIISTMRRVATKLAKKGL